MRWMMLLSTVIALVALGVALHQTAEPLPTWSVMRPTKEDHDPRQCELFCSNRMLHWSNAPFRPVIDVATGASLPIEPQAEFRLEGFPVPIHARGDKLLIGVPGGLEWHDPITGQRKQVALHPDDDVYPSPDTSRLAIIRLESGRSVLVVRFVSWDRDEFEVRAPFRDFQLNGITWLKDNQHAIIEIGGAVLYHVPTRRSVLFSAKGFGRLCPFLQSSLLLFFRRASVDSSWELVDLHNPNVSPGFLQPGGLIRLVAPLSDEEVVLLREKTKEESCLECWNLREKKKRWEHGIHGEVEEIREQDRRVICRFSELRFEIFDTDTGHPLSVAELPIGVLYLFKEEFPALLEDQFIASGLAPTFVRKHARQNYVDLKLIRSYNHNLFWLRRTSLFSQEELFWWRSWAIGRGWAAKPLPDLLICQQRNPPRARFRYPLPQESSVCVARDDSFFVAIEPEGGQTRISRYDLDAPKPWARIVGVPLGLGLVLLTLYALLRRWRRPR